MFDVLFFIIGTTMNMNETIDSTHICNLFILWGSEISYRMGRCNSYEYIFIDLQCFVGKPVDFFFH